jgi:hypothetical protein
MKERPILFSAPMVRAILAGTKTQTRRVVKPAPPSGEAVIAKAGIDFSIFTDRSTPGAYRVGGPVWAVRELMGREPGWRCPYGESGDRLWVRETFIHELAEYCYEASISIPSAQESTVYRADVAVDKVGFGWTPSIHMPRARSRITLEVTGVRVERLHSITDDDARAEGTPCWVCGRRIDGLSEEDCECFHSKAARASFEVLWDGINGKRPACAWADNPWTWVVGFKRVTP